MWASSIGGTLPFPGEKMSILAAVRQPWRTQATFRRTLGPIVDGPSKAHESLFTGFKLARHFLANLPTRPTEAPARGEGKTSDLQDQAGPKVGEHDFVSQRRGS